MKNRVRTEQKKQGCWQEHVQSWEQRGLSQEAYCEANSLALSTFGYWRRKTNHSSEQRPRFYPLAVMPSIEKQDKTPCSGLQLITGEDPFWDDDPFAAIETLSYFTLSSEAWCVLADITAVLLQAITPADTNYTNAVRICAKIPVRSIRSLLGKIAADTENPGSLICAIELARHKDSAGLQRLLADSSEQSMALLACLPIEHLHVDHAPFSQVLTEPNPMIRFWSTLAIARLGDIEPMTQLWNTLVNEKRESPPIFCGNPWTPYNVIVAACPLPESLQTFIRGLYSAELAKHKDTDYPAVKVSRNATIFFGG